MRFTRWQVAILSCAPLVVLSGAVRADVAPPPDYKESCTLRAYLGRGEDCEECRAWHGDVAACERTLGPRGMERRCRTRGASSWNEIWCVSRAAPHPPPPPPPPPPPTSDDPPPDPDSTQRFAQPPPDSNRSPSQARDPYIPPPPPPRGCGGCALGSRQGTVALALLTFGALVATFLRRRKR
jgi:hypothetical protein